jgi:Sigma-70, region 4
MANDFGLTAWTSSNCGSAAQLAGYPLRGTGLMEAAPKADLFEKTMLPDYSAYNLTCWLTRNEHEARDTVQGAYLRAFRFFNSVPQLSFDEIHGPGSGAATVEAKLVEDASFAALRNCLDLLPVEFREVVVMREMEEMSYRDIAEAASAPIGIVIPGYRVRDKALQDCVAVHMKEASK